MLYPKLHPEILNWKKDNKIKFREVPPHNPKCDRLIEGRAPTIVHPVDGLDYYINKSDSTELMLQAQTGNDIQQIYWYVNNRLVGNCKANEKLYIHPPEGTVKISCSDDKGQNSDIKIRVKSVNF